MTPTILQLSDPFGCVSVRSAGQGEPLVLIHGVGMCAAAWAPQITALSQTHHVVAVDMPGHGDSDALARGAALPDFVDWFRSVVNALGLGPVNVAGHSMGALIAGGIAITEPDMIRRVAVLNAVHRRTPAARAAVEQRARDISQGSHDLVTPLDRWFRDTPPERVARANVARWLSEVDPDGYATAYGAFAEGDRTYADGWAQVQCPVLALTGADDPNSTSQMSRDLAQAAQRGKVVILDGHRHMVNLTDPDTVNGHLSDWLAQPVSTQE